MLVKGTHHHCKGVREHPILRGRGTHIGYGQTQGELHRCPLVLVVVRCCVVVVVMVMG